MFSVYSFRQTTWPNNLFMRGGGGYNMFRFQVTGPVVIVRGTSLSSGEKCLSLLSCLNTTNCGGKVGDKTESVMKHN